MVDHLFHIEISSNANIFFGVFAAIADTQFSQKIFLKMVADVPYGHMVVVSLPSGKLT